MRKLITIATAGLMVLSVAGTALAYEPETSPNLPGADNNLKTTSVTLVVVAGTTVYAPATVAVGAVTSDTGAYPAAGALIPGQTATGSGTVYWISNEASKAMYVDLTTKFTSNVSAGVDDTIKYPDTFLAGDDATGSDVFTAGAVGAYTGLTSATNHVKVRNIAGEQSLVGGGDIGATLEAGAFGVKVIIPAAPAATYTGTLTFTVGGASSY